MKISISLLTVFSLHILSPYSHALVTGTSGGMPPLSISQNSIEAQIPLAKKAMKYLDSSPDPFHAVQTSVEMLEDANFIEIKDNIPFKGELKRGGRYYFTRNKSSIVAFIVGNKFEPGNGFKVIGGHTDSPCLKIKPRSKKTNVGCIQLAVE